MDIARLADLIGRVCDKRFSTMRDGLIVDLEKSTADRIERARLNAEIEREQSLRKVADINTLLSGLTAKVEHVESLQAALHEAIDTAAASALTPRGPYKTGEVYRRGDCVMRDGSSWVCVADETAVDPREKTDAPVWRLLAMRGERGQKGEKGDQGESGQRGEKGDQGRQGVAGKDGENGNAGPAGSRGMKGSKGDKGDQGLDGAGIIAIEKSGLAVSIVTSGGEVHRIDFKDEIESAIEKRLGK